MISDIGCNTICPFSKIRTLMVKSSIEALDSSPLELAEA